MSLTYTQNNKESPIAIINDKKVYVDYSYASEPTLKLTSTENIDIIPYVEKNQRYSCYVSGQSGSGKSVFAAKILIKTTS